jgi:hypothetical protein
MRTKSTKILNTSCIGLVATFLIATIFLLTIALAANAAAPGGEWWDSNYQNRKKITITTGATGVPIGYSVSFTEDTALLIASSKLRSDGNDWRIAYWNGSSWVELDRWVDDIIGDGWNTADTITWFEIQAAIGASSSDDNYYVYYEYASETQSAPASMSDSMGADAVSKIFWYADDFEEHASGVDPDLRSGCNEQQGMFGRMAQRPQAWVILVMRYTVPKSIIIKPALVVNGVESVFILIMVVSVTLSLSRISLGTGLMSPGVMHLDGKPTRISIFHLVPKEELNWLPAERFLMPIGTILRATVLRRSLSSLATRYLRVLGN